jgi:hypothetical protein
MVSVSLASIILPFGLGVALATQLSSHEPAGQRLGFILFMGAAMSVTAFPVLARILHRPADEPHSRGPDGAGQCGGRRRARMVPAGGGRRAGQW